MSGHLLLIQYPPSSSLDRQWTSEAVPLGARHGPVRVRLEAPWLYQQVTAAWYSPVPELQYAQ
ncbi:hypothetical protein CSH63_30460 [Micromonospora tulbaghiae]|uniref:Uncharacterized protein n=1 Tax=Micromonospora tulbaghiae TaxID=479978 RepID=A0A386WW31_9ACTN|nr:hypothetical protein CSH63_30460 [Micromonospora tulbaghiae]